MDAATNILRREHAALRKMLEFTNGTADRMHRGESIQAEVIARVTEFFQVFMEERLTTKEEDFLVPRSKGEALRTKADRSH